MKKILLIFVVACAALALTPQTSAASGFNAGHIIDDSVFTNKSAMSVDAIQSFLNSKVTACDTNGNQQSEMNNSGVPDYNGNGSIQRWEWGKYKYDQTSFPCLRDYKQDGISAAQLIYNASHTYSINPQVLLVLLQKEQGLITDTWPLNVQYRSATGYGCPDTAACDSKYYGLKNQIDWASKMFRAILDNSPNWYTPYVLGDNYIQYNPNSSCGGGTVNIQNRSTQALYNYTPYQPNQAALDAGWGTANCGAYGNRNFYLYFTNWFGTVQGSFTSMTNSRWMQLNTATRKIDPSTNQEIGDLLPSGQQIKFTTKIETADGSCLRTQHDTINNNWLCIPITSLEELVISYSSLNESEDLMMLKSQTYKQNLRTNKPSLDFPLKSNQQISLNRKTIIGGATYYITSYDSTNNIESGISASQLEASTVYESISPTWYRLSQDSMKQNPTQQRTIESILPMNTTREFTSRTFVNNRWYYRTSNDTTLNLDKGIPEDALAQPFEAFQAPRWMAATQKIQKINPLTGEDSGQILHEGQTVYFTAKIKTIDGSVYYRTNHDTQNNINLAIPSNGLVDVKFESLKEPRWMITNHISTRVMPYTDSPLSSIPESTQVKITSKLLVNGVVYFRSEEDTNSNTEAAINSSSLSEIKYTPFLQPRELKLSTDIHKQQPSRGVNVDNILPKDMRIKFVSKIDINGQIYYRTEHDTNRSLDKAIPASSLIEVQ